MSDKVDVLGYKLPEKYIDLYMNDPYVRKAIQFGRSGGLPLEDVLLMLVDALLSTKDTLSADMLYVLERTHIPAIQLPSNNPLAQGGEG